MSASPKPLLTLALSGYGVPFDHIHYLHYDSSSYALRIHLKNSNDTLYIQCNPDKYQLVLDHWSTWLARK